MYKVKLRRWNTKAPSSTSSRTCGVRQWPQCQLSHPQTRFLLSHNTTLTSLLWKSRANSSAPARQQCHIPLLWRCWSQSRRNSGKIITDCTSVYHDEAKTKSCGTKPLRFIPSGHPIDLELDYPATTQNCMSCELINGCLKGSARKAFERLRKCRRHTKSVQASVVTEARKTDIEFICARAADLPKILTMIEANKGEGAKYCASVLLCTFLKLFLRCQVFQG